MFFFSFHFMFENGIYRIWRISYQKHAHTLMRRAQNKIKKKKIPKRIGNEGKKKRKNMIRYYAKMNWMVDQIANITKQIKI